MTRIRTRSKGMRSGGSRFGASQNLGMLSLALWLILAGLSTLFGLSFSGLGSLTAVLAIAAGVLILLRK